jgi:hypothetical protein
VLGVVREGREALERALDAERRDAMRANERRIARYLDAARAWRARWPAVEREVAGVALPEAHEVVVARASGVLPFVVEGA